jgi:hypothetical protein
MKGRRYENVKAWRCAKVKASRYETDRLDLSDPKGPPTDPTDLTDPTQKAYPTDLTYAT